MLYMTIYQDTVYSHSALPLIPAHGEVSITPSPVTELPAITGMRWRDSKDR